MIVLLTRLKLPRAIVDETVVKMAQRLWTDNSVAVIAQLEHSPVKLMV
jgi:hypothetical protein